MYCNVMFLTATVGVEMLPLYSCGILGTKSCVDQVKKRLGGGGGVQRIAMNHFKKNAKQR